MTNQPIYAVLTGDLVKSSSLSAGELEAVRDCVLDSIGEIKAWKRGLVKGKPEFFRGDAWQLVIGLPESALRAAIFLRASVLAQGWVDSRISIGLGMVEDVSTKRVSLSTGQAFTLSGHGLDAMTMYARMTIQLSESTGNLANWAPVYGHLCDALIRSWTQRQAEIVRLAIANQDSTHEEIAAMLNPPISKQAATKSLSGANWYAIEEALHCFEQTCWNTTLDSK